MSFQNELGTPIGFEVDLARRLAMDIFGKPDAVKLKPLSNADRLTAVMTDRVDVTIAQVTATDSRRRLVDFSVPYYFEAGAVAVQNPGFQTLGHLRGHPVAVLNNSSTAITLQERVPGVQLRIVTSYREAFELLQQGTVKAVVGDRLALTQHIKQGLNQSDGLRLLKDAVGLYPLAIVMPKGTQYGSLRNQVNRSVTRWQETGWLRDQEQKWGLQGMRD